MEKMVKYHELKRFFKNKKILITGITGFKGSWLAILLLHFGAKIYGIGLKPLKNDLFNLANLKNKTNVKYFDISHEKKLKKYLLSLNPNIVFHLAAQAKVSTSFKNANETYLSNIIGSANLLDIIRNNKISKLKSCVYITSDKCYKNDESGRPYNEHDKLGGSDPYSISKACAEILFDGYLDLIHNKTLGLSSARAGNVIGGGDNGIDRLIPDIFKSIYLGKQLTIRNLNSIRPWQNIMDLILGYTILSYKNYSNNKFNSSWNFAPSKKAIKVKDIMKLIENFNKTEIIYKKTISYNFKDKNTLLLSNVKTKKKLGWKTNLTINKNINLICEWYDEVYNQNKDVYNLCNSQIISYLKKYYN